jgi:hypothetical protein
MNEARNEFIRATFTLSKSDPSAWANFHLAFDAYAVSELERATATSTDDMAISLGMSRRMIDLRNDFRDIQQLMERITKAQR